MTNRPNESSPKTDTFSDEIDAILADHATEESHDFSAEDLHLQAGKRTHRDYISDGRDDMTDPLLVPGKRSPRGEITDEHGDAEPVLVPAPAPEHAGKKNKKKMKLWKKILLGILLTLLLLILGLVIAYFVLYNQGRGEMLSTEDMVLTLPDVLIEAPDTVQSEDGRTVTYKGETYRFNENRANILCLGMDKYDMGGSYGTAGQADAVVLLSIDTVTGDTDALAISRDTIVDINLYAEDGTYYGVENTQLCLAYAYGDGFESSCENMITSVTRILYGIPINTYFTINLGAIPTLNDAVGGVDVTLLNDFRRTSGVWCYKGSAITLNGEEARRYIRSRDTDLLDSNNDRMERQRQYIASFFNKALAATSQNLQVPIDLFNAVSSDTVTNINPSKITFLATTLVQHHSSIQFHSVPGQVVEGEDGYAEFHVDEEALYELVLDLFFTKVTE